MLTAHLKATCICYVNSGTEAAASWSHWIQSLATINVYLITVDLTYIEKMKINKSPCGNRPFKRTVIYILCWLGTEAAASWSSGLRRTSSGWSVGQLSKLQLRCCGGPATAATAAPSSRYRRHSNTSYFVAWQGCLTCHTAHDNECYAIDCVYNSIVKTCPAFRPFLDFDFPPPKKKYVIISTFETASKTIGYSGVQWICLIYTKCFIYSEIVYLNANWHHLVTLDL